MKKQTLIMRKGQAQALSVLGTEVRFLSEADDTGNAWSLMELVVPRDAGPPPHQHDWDEAYYITEGEIEFTIDGRPVLATAGDFLYAPAGAVHGFRGVTERSARMLILDVPAHAGKFFHEVSREVTELPRQLPRVLEIGARNGIRFMPPT
jgi:quercetin dioxygenase-like cupin family protein